MKSHSFHNRPGTDGNHVKIRFDLVQDADGYPPATSENLWAIDLGGGRYQMDNIPFFVMGVSCSDIVSAAKNSDGLYLL